MKRMVLFIILTVFLFTACAHKQEEKAAMTTFSDVSIREVVEEPDPQAAVDAIYATLPESRTTELDSEMLTNKLNISMEDVSEYYGRISDPVGVLSDVIIIYAQEGSRDTLLEALNEYKMQRVREFENYDILNAYSIAQNAVIYDQGDYLILLMLEDNEAAQKIIDQYMPQ